MTDRFILSRRHLLKTTAVGAALGLASASFPISRAFAANLTVGFIYVGPKDDYGYNQAHAEGAAALKSMEGITDRRGGERPRDGRRPEDHGEHDQPGRRDARSSRPPSAISTRTCWRWRRSIPDMQFRHCGGLWTEGKHPMNPGSYFGYIGMGQYLNGIVAGHTTKTKKIGFVAAKPIPQVLLNINCFMLGARAVDPTITARSSSPASGRWQSRKPRRQTRSSTRASTSSPAMSTAQKWWSRRPPAAAPTSAAITPTRARLRRTISDRRRVELGRGIQEVRDEDDGRRAAAEFHARRHRRRLRQDEPATGRGRRARASANADGSSPKS